MGKGGVWERRGGARGGAKDGEWWTVGRKGQGR